MSQINQIKSPLLNSSSHSLGQGADDNLNTTITIERENYGSIERTPDNSPVVSRELSMQRSTSYYGIFAKNLNEYAGDSTQYKLICAGIIVGIINNQFFSKPFDPSNPSKEHTTFRDLFIDLFRLTFFYIPADTILNAKTYAKRGYIQSEATSSIGGSAIQNPASVQALPEHRIESGARLRSCVLQTHYILRETVYLSKLLLNVAMAAYTINSMISVCNESITLEQVYICSAIELYLFFDIIYNLIASR